MTKGFASFYTEASVAKFSQHEDLNAYLLGTGDRVLVEASPLDRIWGIGMGAGNEHASSPDLWRGLNLLGFALMRARDILRGPTVATATAAAVAVAVATSPDAS